MSQDPQTVSIRLLGKEFSVACPPDARQELEQAAHYLDQKMGEIRRNGKLIGLERIAIMAALNISHELIKQRKDATPELKDDVEQLCLKIDSALSKHPRTPETSD